MMRGEGSGGKPGEWTELTTYDCGKYNSWGEVPVTAPVRASCAGSHCFQ